MIDEELVQLLSPEGEPSNPTPIMRARSAADEIFSFYRDIGNPSGASATKELPYNARVQLALWRQFQGQEAAQIGSGRALGPMDFTFPTYREHASRGVAVSRR